MRIIDKNTDYYDYLQDPTDTIVFDRRGSFILTREKLCEGMRFGRFCDRANYRFLLLQCGATFWLFLVTINKFDTLYRPIEYDIECLITWKNYNKPLALLQLQNIDMPELYKYRFYSEHTILHDKVFECAENLKSEIDNGQYKVMTNLSNNTKYTYAKKGTYKIEKQPIPLLKSSGISTLISPDDMYYAIDEYFSLQKSASEKTEAEGTTNNDTIELHGFDTKTSFRGKQNT